MPEENGKVKGVKEDGDPEIDTNSKDKETLPERVKHYFFAEKEVPNVLTYDAVGFDLESSIVKFNMPELIKHAIWEILE